MKVKCVKLLNAIGEKVESSPWIVLGRIYDVFGISIGPDGRRMYQMIVGNQASEDRTLGFLQAECFEITTTIIPSNWRITVESDGSILVGPAAWLEPGFLEAFHDDEPATYPTFERERNVILNEDP